MATYSHSRISCFEQCPLKFKFHYIDKLETERKDSVEAFLGSRVHEALEKLYKDLKFQKQNSLPELLEFYNREWEKNWNPGVHITRDDYTAENYRLMGEKYIKDYYNRYSPFDQARTIGLETEDYADLDAQGDYKIHVRIDRLALAPDGTYEIHDYKTANSLPSQQKLDEDRQLAIYAYGLKKMYPDAEKIRLVWHFLAFDREMSSTRTAEQIEALRQEVLEQIARIEQEKEFSPLRSALCDWCEYQADCPNFRHLFATKDLPAQEFLNEDGVSLVNRYAALKVKKDEFEEKLEKVKDALVVYAEKNSLNEIMGSDQKMVIRTYPRLSFPKKGEHGNAQFQEIIMRSPLAPRLATVDVYELAKLINSGLVPKDVMDNIEPFITKGKTVWTRLCRR